MPWAEEDNWANSSRNADHGASQPSTPLSPVPAPNGITPVQQQPMWRSKEWLKELKELPELREIPWKSGTQPASANNRRESIAACILAMRGKIAQTPCTCCARGKGNFSFCISLQGWFNGSCANCYYGAQGSLCSFRGMQDGARKKPTPSKRKANTQGTQQDGAHDDSERDNHGPRKRQRRPTSASMRYDEAIKLSMAALESPEPEPEHPINVIVSDIVGAQRGNAATRPASELENTSNSQRPSGFRARRGKSSSGMRSSLGSSSRHEAHGMDRMNVHSDDGFDHHRRNTIDVVGSSRVDPGRSIQNSHSKAARQNSHTQASILSQNGIMGPGIPHSEVSSGKLPSVAIIDTLSKSQQRQIYGILSGIEGGMAHLQKQFKTLQNLLGIDTDDE